MPVTVLCYSIHHFSYLAAAGLDQDVDAGVEHGDGQQQGHEDGDAEGHVLLGVERQHRGAVREVVQAVPAQDGQRPEGDGYQPARTYITVVGKSTQMFLLSISYQYCKLNTAKYFVTSKNLEFNIYLRNYNSIGIKM